MNRKKLFTLAAALLAAAAMCFAQTEKTQVIEEGGTGPWKSVAVGDASLPTHTIYRPQNLKAYVDENGKIPVLLYANGACANNNLEMSRLLSEVASYGYLVLAIGPYEDMPDDKFYAQWKGVVRGWYPETKEVAIMGNGERLTPYTAEEQAARAAEQEAARKAAEAAAMGQSCGGAQVLAVAHDPRIKTCMIFNSGMGEMAMSGASKESLANLHTPMLYINGGTADVARMWLNWQLKGKLGDSALFLNDAYGKALYPNWTFDRKNC